MSETIREYVARREQELDQRAKYVSGKDVNYLLLVQDLMKEYNICHVNGRWYFEVDGVYREDKNDKALNKIFNVRLQNKGTTGRRNTVEQMLEAEAPGTFDNDPFLVNVKNGFYDIRSGELKDHYDEDGKPRNRTPTQIPFEYNPDADCPIFKEYLRTSVPSETIREDLQRALGSSLIRKKIDKWAFFIPGQTNTGKSQLEQIMNHILGDDNVGAVTLDRIDDDGTVISFQDMWLNYCAELPSKNRIIQMDRLKKLTSGDKIDVRIPYGRSTTKFRNTATIIFATNHLPDPAGFDDAMWERTHILPFRKTAIPEEDRIVNLADKIIEEEAEGVVNWLLEGAVKYYDNDGDMMTEQDPEHQRLLMMDPEDSIEAFIEHGCWRVMDEQRDMDDLYDSFLDFCDNFNFEVRSKQGFHGAIFSLCTIEDGKVQNIEPKDIQPPEWW